ncbi:MAG TPA: ferric reductase-like transmembrane domain-containing protein, partial [Mycobacteriales bacterium]|nr:ferric reductase-like transmembrane domain-containing protein [Mycobacteriales bacterium]
MTTALAATVNPRALWYLTRGSGLVSLVLLTAVVMLGLLATGRWSRPGWPRFVTADLHRNLSLLTVVFVAVHVVTAVADSFAPISWLNAVVPFTGRYRPLWLGFGALASDLLLALIVTSLLRVRLGPRVWRGVHWLAYACWPVAVLHGLGTGSDTRIGWAQVATWGCVTAVVAGLGWRLLRDAAHRPGGRVAAAIATVAVALALGGVALAGPLSPGWARRAGTPTRLLAQSVSSVAVAARSAAGAASGALALPYTGTFRGSITQSAQPDGTSTVRLVGSVSGVPAATLAILLEGQALDNGGVAMTASQVRLTPLGSAVSYSGAVVGLSQSTLEAQLSDAAGGSVLLRLRMTIAGTSVTGSALVESATAGTDGTAGTSGTSGSDDSGGSG